MNNYIIGTSGHIDHGKTSLIKALTGINTDRLKEEQEKGISIDIGFSYLDFDDYRIGIVDIPGHEKFIKNMLAGASGIDICLFIVAADDGIMPQTTEHFDILTLLDIKHGIIVLNKSDRVNEELLAQRKQELKEFVTESFLENSPIITTSIYDEESINNLKVAIKNTIESINENPVNYNVFRMAIDRSFSLNGIGHIITGTSMGKNVSVKDKLEILPQRKLVNIKNIQSHDISVETLSANNRCALNITYNDDIKIKRGNVIATPNMLSVSKIIDIKLTCLKKSAYPIKNNQRIRVYHLANEIIARVKLLDSDVIEPGKSGYAQLLLENEIIAINRDRLIIRNYSPLITIGGGIILNASSSSVKRFNKDYIESLVQLETSDEINLVSKTIYDNSPNYYTLKDYEPIFNSINNYLELISELDNKIVYIDDCLIHIDYYNELKNEIADYLKVYHENNPQSSGEQITIIREKFFPNVKNKTANSVLNSFDFKIKENNIALPSFEVTLDQEEEIVKKLIIKAFKKEPYKMIKVGEVKETIRNKTAFDNVFSILVKNKDIIRIEDDQFILKEYLSDILQFMSTLEKIEISDVRNYTNTSRKHIVAILEYFDKNHYTKRTDNYRVVLKKEI